MTDTTLQEPSSAARAGADVRIDLCTSRRGALREQHLTAAVETPVPAQGLAGVFEAVAARLAREGIEPIAEKVYGAAHAREAILAARREAFAARGLDASTPVTFVSGAPACGGLLAGIHVWGVAREGADRPVRTVSAGPVPVARLWSAAGFRLLHLPAVRGTTPAGGLPTQPHLQAEQMFHNAAAGAAAQGFRYGQAVRTWIYVARLLDWYGELNRVRSALYEPHGFGNGRGTPAFPASTGIQGRCAEEQCLMDVLLLDAQDAARARAQVVERTARQGPAARYGAAFSRGVLLDLAGSRTLHVSGTASIDAQGRSTHPGDPDGQCRETLRSVAAVIDQAGGSLADIVSATVFVKDAEAYAAYRRVAAAQGVPSFPAICVTADVCRPELLVEREAVVAP